MSKTKKRVYKTQVGKIPKIVDNFDPKTENQKLGESISSNLGIDNTLILNKLKFFSDDKAEYLDKEISCPRREPLYTEYIIYGNIIFLIEPLRTSGEDSNKFLENLVSKLP